MAEGQHTTEIITGDSEVPPQHQQNNPFFFLSLIPKFLLKPFVNNDNKGEKNGKSVKKVDGEESSGSNSKTPDVVRFPVSKPEVSPLKVESEDAQEDTNPLILWPIYALGGFIVLKWAWGKWQERKANQGSSGEDQPPASDQPPTSDPASAPAED